MQRKKFIEMGGLLAVTAAQMNTFAGSPRPPKSNDHQDKVDFMFDGVELSPKECEINPTINRIQSEALAGLFLESLKGLK